MAEQAQKSIRVEADMIRVITSKSKRLLAEHLVKNDPETLEFIKSMADKFGPMAEIGYEGPADHVLKERLVEIRRQQIQDAKDKLT